MQYVIEADKNAIALKGEFLSSLNFILTTNYKNCKYNDIKCVQKFCYHENVEFNGFFFQTCFSTHTYII